MARGKGTANLAASLEVLAGAPLDARLVCPTVADLYIASNWPYKYIGMKTTVQSTGDTYRLINLDVTQASSWVKEGATEYADFTGATSQAAGIHGLVPAPAITDMEKFLKGDGTWGVVPMPFFDYSNTSPDAMNFSTDEKIIGTWVDGKPLYQKTFICGALPNNTTKNVAHGIANIGVIIDCFGFAIKTGGLLTLPNLYPKNLSGCVGTGANTTDIYIVTAVDQSSWTESYLTIRYTKTTDSPVASGEKIIGQWIDGRPIYQKTVDCGALPNANTKSVATGITNAEHLIFWTGCTTNASNATKIALPRIFKDNADIMATFAADLTHIVLKTESDRTSLSAYVTIQYTKAS